MAAKKKINVLIEYLTGTCHSLDEGCRHCDYAGGEDDLTKEERSYLDEHIGCCDLCGWWDERGCINDEEICDDCNNG